MPYAERESEKRSARNNLNEEKREEEKSIRNTENRLDSLLLYTISSSFASCRRHCVRFYRVFVLAISRLSFCTSLTHNHKYVCTLYSVHLPMCTQCTQACVRVPHTRAPKHSIRSKFVGLFGVDLHGMWCVHWCRWLLVSKTMKIGIFEKEKKNRIRATDQFEFIVFDGKICSKCQAAGTLSKSFVWLCACVRFVRVWVHFVERAYV